MGAVMDADGMPVLPVGLYWRATTELFFGTGLMQIRTVSRWGKGALVWEHRFWPSNSLGMPEAARLCYTAWQQACSNQQAMRDYRVEAERHG